MQIETNTVLSIGKDLRLPEKHITHGTRGTRGGMCLICGCTDARACLGGCVWENDDRNLCTACAERVLAIVSPAYRDRLMVEAAICREPNRNVLTLALEYAMGDWRRSLIRLRLRDLGCPVADSSRTRDGR